MKKLILLPLFGLLALFGFGAPVQAAESASPYDTVMGTSKDVNSVVDGVIDGCKNVDKETAGKLADFLKNSSFWKKLSENSKNFLTNNIGKLGPLVKKLGWIANAIDLAPSVYNLATSILSRDKVKFRKSFRETALKSLSIAVGIGIGAAVTAATPAVVAAVAATGGVALVAVAAGGAIVSYIAGKGIDKVAESWLTKPLENFADKLYDSLFGGDKLDLPPDGGGGFGGSGSSSGGRSAPRGGGGRRGSGKLHKLQW